MPSQLTANYVYTTSPTAILTFHFRFHVFVFLSVPRQQNIWHKQPFAIYLLVLYIVLWTKCYSIYS